MCGRRIGGRLGKVLVALFAIVVPLGAQPSSGEAQAQLEKELVVVTTGGVLEETLKENFYEPFTRATGVAIRTVATSSSTEQWAKVKAMTQVGKVEWDIVTAAPEGLLSQRAVLARLDCRALPNVAAHGIGGACEEYGLMRDVYGAALAYNTQKFPTGQHPRSWADFWDVKRFPGPRALGNAGVPWEVLTVALLADGVPSDKLFPLDLDRAFRKLDRIKPHVAVWWKTGAQSQQIMRDGEVVMAMMWSGRALNLKASGLPVDVEWNQGLRGSSWWAILKDAPHPRAALAFLNFFMDRPEAHLAFSRKIFYDTSNRKALELLPEMERRTRQTYPENWNRMVDLNDRWISENRAMLLERWNTWLAR